MEFASEMLEVAITNNLKIAEVPITYYPRPEGSEPNLSSFSDGGRHLKHIFLRAPTLLFLIPGSILFAVGTLLVFLIWAPFNLWAIRLVCKDLRRVSWFGEPRRDNGICFKAY
jgi:hypothetical protein